MASARGRAPDLTRPLGRSICPAVSQQPAAPLVFDRRILRLHQRRALVQADEDFLLRHAAADLVDRLAPVQRSFSRVLDLGTPRPTLAALLRSALPQAQIVRAAPVLEAAGDSSYLRLVADEERQPFAPESFDLAVSVLALHAANDLPGALVQIRRALKPDGLFLGCMLGGQTLSELRQALFMAEAELAGGASPRVAPFSDLRDLGHLLQRTGFALPVTDVEPLAVRYATAFGLIADLRAMGATNALVLRRKQPTGRKILLRAAEIYSERFTDPDGRLRATFELVWLSGWAPHESQQKPLKPGSARMKLVDALKARTPGAGEPGR